MLESEVRISSGDDIGHGAELVAEQAGELGLLDATRLAATADGIPLPAPYLVEGAAAFLRDLRDPEALSDDILSWTIDMPGTGGEGPYGLRFHESTRPVIRKFSLYLAAENEDEVE